MPVHPKLFAGHWYAVDLVTVFWMVVIALIMIIFLAVMSSRLNMRSPRGLQNVMEWGIDFARSMAKDTMPSDRAVRVVLPFAFIMLVYLFVANWLGLIATVEVTPTMNIPWLGIQAGVKYSLLNSPTENMNQALGLAVLVWLVAHGRGLRHPLHWLKHFINPMHIVDEITNPLTHGMRLFGNILAGEVLIEAVLRMPKLFGFVPTGLPLLIVWLLYSAFVSTIQAYIFAMLLTLYVGNKEYEPGQAH